jgi:site-specific recombinase
MNWWQQFKDRLASLRGHPALDALLAHARPDQSLAERVAWAEDLLMWMRRDVPATRLRLLLQILERQPEVHKRVAQTLRSIVRDTEALDLFADTGLPSGTGFTRELLSRLVSGMLPEPPDTRDLADIIDRLFPPHSVGNWLDQLEPELGNQVVALFHYEEMPDEGGWNSLRTDLEDALVQLADRICVVGSHRGVRARLGKVPFRDLPFQKLPPAVEALLARRQAGVPLGELAAELNVARAAMDACDKAVEEVIGRLEKTGISTALVYDIERLRAQIRRLELLLEAWSSPVLEPARTMAIVADLVRENHARRSVRAFCRQNLQMLTRRIVERNAETGEHCVARNGREYLAMFGSAAGGGVVLGATAFIKLLLAKLVLAEFFRGAFYGLNYAASFVVAQLLGYTVATKQPATTAPALARRMSELRTPSQLEALVDEVVFLIRSQIASVFGNLALVIPSAFLLDLAWKFFTGAHVLDEHKAEVVLGSVMPWSGCWLYAAFMGVFLWVSSVFAAWIENWFVLHQIGPALLNHRGLQYWLGPTRTRRLAAWLEHNIAALAGNISLGLLLGFVPSVGVFFGLPLELRHVTLSTGQVTAAFAGLGHFWTLATVWVVIGIFGIGMMNILVSFSLALFVAIRARNVRGPELRLFYGALFKRVLKSPLSFLLPVGVTASAKVDLSAH